MDALLWNKNISFALYDGEENEVVRVVTVQEGFCISLLKVHRRKKVYKKNIGYKLKENDKINICIKRKVKNYNDGQIR